MQPPTVTVATGMVVGVDAEPIVVEATARSASDGTPRILGLVDAAVREAYHRVLNAFFALGLPTPRGVTTVNFAPAALRKRGHGFDLPLALALAGAGGMFAPERTQGLCAFGEISLRGRVLPARGIVSVALMARGRGHRALLCGPGDAALCAGIAGIDVLGAETLADALYWVAGRRELPAPAPPASSAPPAGTPAGPDLLDLRGHATPKQALCVAAAGGHNLLFVGPPGSGKTALCRRLPGLLPPCSDDERMQVLQVHAAAGLPQPPDHQRPLRAPHHTSSVQSLLGGGAEVRPGEVTLAHRGVLFLDELPEFRRDALEAMRQPLEDGFVTVGRAAGTVTMPAVFLLAAAMNPCPCGYLGHRHRPCTCTPPAVARYRRRLSGPLLDRIDLQVEVPALDPAELLQPPDPALGTASLRARVDAARSFQRHGRREVANAQLADRALERACRLDDAARRAMLQVLQLHRAGPRAHVRLLRLARTLADLDQRSAIAADDVLEAAALRGFTRQDAAGLLP